jgi:hypothetical protein
MQEIEELLEKVFALAQEQFPFGHLKGDQIKTNVKNAMANINHEKAMVMNGILSTGRVGRAQFGEYPIGNLAQTTTKKNERVEAVQTGEVDPKPKGESEPPAEPKGESIVDDIINMNPKKAVEKFGIDAITEILKSLGVDFDGSLGDVQLAAVLIKTLKSQTSGKK